MNLTVAHLSTNEALMDRSLGDLARSLPGATALFFRYALDFCCSGNASLRAALAEKGLPAQPLLDELAALQDQPDALDIDWRKASTDQLIDHILSRFHQRHRQQLPELIRLSRRVEMVHAERPECPHGLADHLEDMFQELESHMQKEEQILFPMLRSGVPPMGLPPVSMMRHEHLQHGEALARMVALAHGLAQPPGACNTWRALLAGLHTLREDLMLHIHLENNLLFEGLNLPDSSLGCGSGGGGCGRDA